MYGLVSAIHPADSLVDEAVKLAEKICTHSKVTVQFAKEAVNSAYETTLAQGILFERRLFHATFGHYVVLFELEKKILFFFSHV